eukprot:scaffold183906_cov55-Attheya_sp.AAC.1
MQNCSYERRLYSTVGGVEGGTQINNHCWLLRGPTKDKMGMNLSSRVYSCSTRCLRRGGLFLLYKDTKEYCTMSIRHIMTGAGIAETSASDNELFSEEELNDEAFENMVGGSFHTSNSDSEATAAVAQQEEEDYEMDDELEHLAKAEEVLRQELDSVHVVADPAVTSPRLSNTSLLLEEDIDEGGNEDDHDSIEDGTDNDSSIKEGQTVDHDDRRNDKNNTMDFSSILPVADSKDTFSDDEEEVAELKSLFFPETLKREMDFEDEAEDGIFEPMKDTFSLMFVCNIKSLGFTYSVFFFALQVAILVLISINVLLDAPDGNPLNVPVGTRVDVIAAQVLALFVSLITQSDFLATFDLINVKYDDTVLSLFEQASRTKWIVSNICRFFVGVLSIAISFILIVQSTTVIELFFNFAAVQFVSELDNIAFHLAYKGYMVIGDLEQTTRKLMNHVQFRQRNM